MLCQDGFLPTPNMTPAELKMLPGSEKLVCTGMLLRSKLYFQALLSRDELFARGLTIIYHDGPHHYYKCILGEDADVDRINSIVDVSALLDSDWKLMLADAPVARLAALGDRASDSDGDEEGPAPAAPLLPPPLPSHGALLLEPQTFLFSCDTAEGEKELRVHLDGFSHQSRRRRAYAQCPHVGHTSCHHYRFMDTFTHAWQSVAHIVVSVRQGILAEDKREHLRQHKPSEAELDDVQHEMPAILWADFPLALPAD